MSEIKVPVLPESVADATVAKWYKQPGDVVKRDENLVDLETDKVMLEVSAPADGVLSEIIKGEGDVVVPSDVLGKLTPGAAPSASAPTEASASAASDASTDAADEEHLSPAVRRLVQEHSVDVSQITGTGKGGRIVKEDVMKVIEGGAPSSAPAPATTKQVPAPGTATLGAREEKRVPMSRIRARIAERLVQVTQETAMLTTFNEINMKPVMDLRQQYKDPFEKAHGVKLGFMSFFVKAAVEALKRFPAVNASVDGTDLVYHGYFDIGIAVSTDRGLVVPVLRDADQLSMADVESGIRNYALRARDNKLTMDDMTGGTFTITNGGVFGSMMSTPIINAPQSGILGMHNIVERPVVENGEIAIRPMMYVALSYDHRVIDGRDSVGFLVTIKQLLEDPARMLLEL